MTGPAHSPLVAALRLAKALDVEGDDLTASERRVMVRALHHHLRVACADAGVRHFVDDVSAQTAVRSAGAAPAS